MIDEILKEISEEIINLRRFFHKNPEMAFEEFTTSKKIAEYLKSIGIEVWQNVAKTGVVGLIRGNGEGKTILLRADMDALPLQEEASHNYCSQTKGIMHACGHDVHISTLLGAATVLQRLKHTFNGNVKLIFQPAEEATGGAEPMIKQGVLENPKVDCAFAFHIWDSIKAGQVMVKYGSVMASPDHFNIYIKGRGGHGAIPAPCINPISVGAQIVDALHKIKTEKQSVVTICSFQGGNSGNIIPDTAILKGTARTLDPQTRKMVYELICKACNDIAKSAGAKCEIDYRFLYPPCINDDKTVDLFVESAKKIIGSDNILFQQEPDMIGEDFAYFAEKVPACFVKLGGATAPLHTSKFDVDEKSIIIGAKLMSAFAIDYLK